MISNAIWCKEAIINCSKITHSTSLTGSCNFIVFEKPLLVLINTKLHSKSFYYQYLSFYHFFFIIIFIIVFITIFYHNNHNYYHYLIYISSTFTSAVALMAWFVPKQPPSPFLWLGSGLPWGSACNSYQPLDRDKVIIRWEDKTKHVTFRSI